jgi:hypothetical protein
MVPRPTNHLPNVFLRSVEQADNDGIDNFGLLIFVGRIDHVVIDLHRFWKVHRGDLEQFLGTP